MGVLVGYCTDDVNMHIMNFMEICTLYKLPGVIQVQIRLRLFLFSLIEKLLYSWFNYHVNLLLPGRVEDSVLGSNFAFL